MHLDDAEPSEYVSPRARDRPLHHQAASDESDAHRGLWAHRVRSTFANRKMTMHLPAIIDVVQWPAMAVTVAASWYVASSEKPRRNIGFWLFLVSNLLWVAWGVYAHAYALIVLQVCLAVMNVRGAAKSDSNAAGQ
jgi:hypothetical protein